MKNFWLDTAKKRKMFKEIDEIAMDVWSNDGTLGDFIAALSDEQMAFLMEFRLGDLSADADELTFGFEFVGPC